MVINKVISFHQHKEEERHLKILGKEKEEEDEKTLPSPLKRKNLSTSISPWNKIKVYVIKEKAIDKEPPRRIKLVQ